MHAVRSGRDRARCADPGDRARSRGARAIGRSRDRAWRKRDRGACAIEPGGRGLGVPGLRGPLRETNYNWFLSADRAGRARRGPAPRARSHTHPDRACARLDRVIGRSHAHPVIGLDRPDRRSGLDRARIGPRACCTDRRSRPRRPLEDRVRAARDHVRDAHDRGSPLFHRGSVMSRRIAPRAIGMIARALRGAHRSRSTPTRATLECRRDPPRLPVRSPRLVDVLEEREHRRHERHDHEREEEGRHRPMLLEPDVGRRRVLELDAPGRGEVEPPGLVFDRRQEGIVMLTPS